MAITRRAILTKISEMPGAGDPLVPWLTRVIPPFDGRSPAGMFALLKEHLPGAVHGVEAVGATLKDCSRRDMIMQAVWERVLIVHTVMMHFGVPTSFIDPEEELRNSIKDVLQHYLEGEDTLRAACVALDETGSFHEP